MTQSLTFACRRLCLFSSICLLFNTSGSAQLAKHGNIWHFGYRSGLDFSSGAPVQLSNIEVDSYEGCASWSDADGKLQVYTNGGGFFTNVTTGPRSGYIWNKNQQVIYDMGDSQGGGYSASQSSLIIPLPGAAETLYVFTMDHGPNSGAANRGLSYFVVDMTQNSGNGAVLQANINAYKPAVEGLTAVLHENGKDFWLICLDLNSDNFVVLPFTAAGVGAAISYPNTGLGKAENMIKAAPDGRKICLGRSVYTFDRATGQPTFQVSLGIDDYSFSFSPSGRFLYSFTPLWGALVRHDLYQVAGDIPKSTDTIQMFDDLPFPGMMQLAPDGNLYYTEQSLNDFIDPLAPTVSLCVIRCPDGVPELERSIIKFETDFLNAGGTFSSLPNFTDYIFERKQEQDTLNLPLCNTVNGVLLQPEPGLSYYWSTKDTLAQITVFQPGTYTCYTLQECGFKTRVFQVEDQSGALSIDVPGGIADTCNAFPLTLVATGPAGVYNWSNGSSANATTINNFGIYTVSVTNVCGTSTATYTLEAQPLSLSLAPVTPILDTCNVFPLQLMAQGSGNGNYQWSDGSTNNTLTMTSYGSFSATFSNACGSASATYNLNAPSVKVEIAPENPIQDSCNVKELVLRATSNHPGAFLWSDGSTNATLTIAAEGVFSVRLTTACGTAVDTFRFETKGTSCCDPRFPNAFTPDGDTVNDVFSAYLNGCDVEYADTYVYSRWGELMFQSIEKTDSWDGTTQNGTSAPCDVYVYTCRYKLKGDENEKFVKGEIVLLR